MITNFKIFESSEPKFNIGDYVYDKNDNTKKRYKIKEVLNKQINNSQINYYILEEYPYAN